MSEFSVSYDDKKCQHFEIFKFFLVYFKILNNLRRVFYIIFCCIFRVFFFCRGSSTSFPSGNLVDGLPLVPSSFAGFSRFYKQIDKNCENLCVRCRLRGKDAIFPVQF